MIKIGCTRIVFILKTIVIKIPNFLYQHNHFLQGCYANWSERYFTKIFKNNILIEKVAPTLFCSYFGLISIQKKVIELNRNLTTEEINHFQEITSDIKIQNFGYLNNKLVCIDYT